MESVEKVRQRKSDEPHLETPTCQWRDNAGGGEDGFTGYARLDSEVDADEEGG